LTSVLVSHPHVAAFAAGLAERLAGEGKLSGFYTGVAFARGSWPGHLAEKMATRWPVARNRILKDMPAERLHSQAALEIGARLAGRLLRRTASGVRPYDAIFMAHDRLVSLLPWPASTTAVYAYEDASLWTFQRAARRHLERIWDLPLPHYRTIEQVLAEEHRRWPEAITGVAHREPLWKQRRKDAELALATKVAVASAFTRKSLEGLAPGVPILVTPYGFPVEQFSPRASPPSGRFTALSVGTHDLRKGTPYLLEAWKRAAIPDAELHLVGPLKLAKPFVDRYAGTFRHWPHVPKSELPARYAGADLLVFPTLGDGFGLVIQEAMCTGTPVVTTPCGGGPECITDGVDGWIVPPRDIDALVDRLRACAANRDRLAEIGRAARARAERWTWSDAGRALSRALEG
jgi:glycosyltransferase involved in cell wall biosynthesis